MSIESLLSDLNVNMELARDQADQAHLAFEESREQLLKVKSFCDSIKATGEICDIHNKGNNLMNALYMINGTAHLLVVTKLHIEDCICFCGHIFAVDDPVFACHFYAPNIDDNKDIFDILLLRYVEFYFDIEVTDDDD